MKKIVLFILLGSIFTIGTTGCGKKESKTPNKPKEEEATKISYEDGKVIYFDPEKGEMCDEASAISKTEVSTGCMKWFVFGDSKEATTVNMLLDHNIVARVLPNQDNRNNGENEVYDILKEKTDNWVGTNDIKETIDGINYEGYHARLITAKEIADIVKYPNSDSISNSFYFDTLSDNDPDFKNDEKSKYAYLYNYLYVCEDFGCSIEDPKNDYKLTSNKINDYSDYPLRGTYGYWTSTKVPNDIECFYAVETIGTLIKGSAFVSDYGIRPVINIDKKLIK